MLGTPSVSFGFPTRKPVGAASDSPSAMRTRSVGGLVGVQVDYNQTTERGVGLGVSVGVGVGLGVGE